MLLPRIATSFLNFLTQIVLPITQKRHLFADGVSAFIQLMPFLRCCQRQDKFGNRSMRLVVSQLDSAIVDRGELVSNSEPKASSGNRAPDVSTTIKALKDMAFVFCTNPRALIKHCQYSIAIIIARQIHRNDCISR